MDQLLQTNRSRNDPPTTGWMDQEKTQENHHTQRLNSAESTAEKLTEMEFKKGPQLQELSLLVLPQDLQLDQGGRLHEKSLDS